MNKILVVSSPHAYTTRDVWKRVIAGLDANGAHIQPYDLLPRYSMYEFFMAQARKHNFPLPPSFGVNTLACEPVGMAAPFYDCDTVLIVSPQYFPMSIVDVLRKIGIKTAAYFTEAPYEDTLNAPVQASHFDVVLVNDRNSVGLFKSFCDDTYYLPHSYDPELHHPGGKRNGTASKALFIGTGYPSRCKFLQRIDWAGIDLELHGLWWLPSRSRLRPFVQGKVMDNEDVAERYRAPDVAVAISMHRNQRYVDDQRSIDLGEAYSVGPRTLELAACGLFQVSDHRDELTDIFGDAVPEYETPRELQALLRRALDEPAWREDLAARQLAAMEDGRHSAKDRMQIVLEAVA